MSVLRRTRVNRDINGKHVYHVVCKYVALRYGFGFLLAKAFLSAVWGFFFDRSGLFQHVVVVVCIAIVFVGNERWLWKARKLEAEMYAHQGHTAHDNIYHDYRENPPMSSL